MKDTIIKKIISTEKTSRLQEQTTYVFMVEPSANKSEIKKAIQSLYRVEVTGIHTLRRKEKFKRFRKSVRLSPLLKKAMVTLKVGQKIDIA